MAKKVSESVEKDVLLVESLLKSMGYYLQRQGKDTTETEAILASIKRDAVAIANGSQKKFVVSLED